MEILVLLAISLPLLLLFKLKNHYVRKSNRGAPGPPGLPWIGNMHQLDTSNIHICLQKLSHKYGPFMSLQLGSFKALVISSPSAAKEVFKYHDLCFSSKPILVGLQKLTYNHQDIVFSPYNDYWRNMRKISTLHLFSSKRSQSFQPIREEEVARMVKTIRDEAVTGSNVVNLSKTITTLVTSIILRITFGKIYDGARNSESNSDISTEKLHWLLDEIRANVSSFFLADYFPLVGSFVDRLSGVWSQSEKRFNEIDAFTQQIIDEYLHTSSASTEDFTILDILLQMKKDLSDFTLGHVKAILLDILIAASDTSSSSTVWAMSLLMKNPARMKKAREEVRELIGKKGFIDEVDVQKLVYLKAVVKESMRMQPPVPFVLRETIDKCVVSGYEIEAKTRVYLNVYAIGRDPKAWENPDAFVPERFINSSIDVKGQDFELLPFGAGRRICPGMLMGLATTELALANLLYSFNWELPPGTRIEDIDMASQPGFVMHKKTRLCLVPKIMD
ncbi:6,7,8-trihydroxycoumarin synthase-like [Apium graveolens]|uniref:6,7,8-trihydroxycoumarin synthase-like n=1 Tax=Apium graveolens TaxID=4045 RepID=UPI003D7BD68B